MVSGRPSALGGGLRDWAGGGQCFELLSGDEGREVDGERQRKPRGPQKKPEVKPTEPNQIWSWDVTYIALGPIFVYPFAIIDVFSRKIVGWHLGFNATVESMKKAWDKALCNEGLLDVAGAPQMPTALSDQRVRVCEPGAKAQWLGRTDPSAEG